MNLDVFTHRRTLLPFLAKKLRAKKYLEIGVKGGKTFLPIKVRKKFAVDPDFRIKADYRRSQIFSYPFNYFAKYFPCTSDEFFAKHAEQVLQKECLQLAFIDGLHTFEQSYQDIINTLPYLSPTGIMLVHDCSPHSSAAAFPANSIDEVKKINPPGFDGRWCGDVWKVIPKLKKDYPGLTVFVIDHDSGLGIISKQPGLQSNGTKDPNYSIDEINQMNYEDMDKDRENMLNIVDIADLSKHLDVFKL